MAEVFSENRLGKNAEWIVRNEPCVGCGGSASSTVDFDVLGDASQIPVCDECRGDVVDRIVEDLRTSGVGEENIVGTIGRNGQGRA